MTTGRAGMVGKKPTVKIEPIQEGKKKAEVTELKGLSGKDVKDMTGVNPEQIRYEQMYEHPEYKQDAPGTKVFPVFMDACRPPRGASFVDWGCATGRVGHMAYQAGMDVKMVDFAHNCLDDFVRSELCEPIPDRPHVPSLQFILHDITKPIDLRADYGYCGDVMEHIPEEDVPAVLENIINNCTECFFQIATFHEAHGPKFGIGQLHLTVRPYNWWLKQFADLGCVILHSNEFENHVLFHVSGKRNAFWNNFQVNTPQEKVWENMEANKHVQPLMPHQEQEREIMLLAGGPSLNDFEDEIRQKRAAGTWLCTVNGTYNWCLERGITPSTQFMIDAREFNKRFVEPVVDTCKYVFASQCDPKVVASTPPENTFLMQATLEDEDIEVINKIYGTMYEDWYPVPGGSTVVLRTLNALLMMGFRKIHVYGFDSCLSEDEAHHAYEQTENDDGKIIEVRVGYGTKHEKRFKCHVWMAVQAKEFLRLVPIYYKDLQLQIHGDGLIAHIVETGAGMTSNWLLDSQGG